MNQKNHFEEVFANKQILYNLPYFLSYFGIRYTEWKNRYAFSCPIHNSDNPESGNIFKQGQSGDGNFKCWTHHCEKDVGYNAYYFFKYLVKKKKRLITTSG